MKLVLKNIYKKSLDFFTEYFVDAEFLLAIVKFPQNIVSLILLITANMALYNVSPSTTIYISITIGSVFLVGSFLLGKTNLRIKIEEKRGKKSGPWIELNKRLDHIEKMIEELNAKS